MSHFMCQSERSVIASRDPGVVVVVRLRVNFFKRACDIEGVVDYKCDVVFSE